MKGIAMLEPRNFVICWFGHLSLKWSVAGSSPIFAHKVATRLPSSTWLLVAKSGVMVYWSIHSTLTLRARVRISPSPWHFCPSARQFIHIAALDPGV